MEFIEVKTTFEVQEEAQKMAETLLDKKLVACAQIHEIESHYVWNSERTISKEYLLVAKTKMSLYKQVEETIKKHHSYELPEIVATKLCCGLKDYFDWIDKNTL